ncbi:MAG TPA: hypothetical protein VHU61_05435 [Solirubrobacteraceae bacterium]|jgi:hypothetical protein|nr:hypothetical protein [Solirubrobacteraceae bacterium]
MTTLNDDLARDRHAARYPTERRQSAAGRHAKNASALARTRNRAGWLLVGFGLRLVLPGRHGGARRTRLIGQ